MVQESDIRQVLSGVVHPESGVDVVSGGIVAKISTEGGRAVITLTFARARDPFEASIKKQCRLVLEDAFADLAGKVDIIVKAAVEPKAAPKKSEPLEVTNIIAVSSGKGGVGKSTVACNLAIALAKEGYRVGLLDADIYGPSQPKMFGLEDYKPEGERVEGKDMILPAEAYGVKVMSIGFFIPPGDALIWRGAMATNALRQMIHQTLWGGLDFLLIDMPPGTGDVHLTIVQEMKVTGAVIVSTPQQVALADVERGIAMFRADGVGVPVLGLIDNMAWFTPEELPDNRYYIFGRGGAEALAAKEGIDILAHIPIVQGISEGSDSGRPVVESTPALSTYYTDAARKIVDKCVK